MTFIDRYFLPVNGLLDNQGSLVSSEEAFSLLREPLALVGYDQKKCEHDFLARLDNQQFARIEDVGVVGGELDSRLLFLFAGKSPAAKMITDSVPYYTGLAMTEHHINWSKPKKRPFSFLGWLKGSDYCPGFEYKGTKGTMKTRYFLDKIIKELEQQRL